MEIPIEQQIACIKRVISRHYKILGKLRDKESKAAKVLRREITELTAASKSLHNQRFHEMEQLPCKK